MAVPCRGLAMTQTTSRAWYKLVFDLHFEFEFDAVGSASASAAGPPDSRFEFEFVAIVCELRFDLDLCLSRRHLYLRLVFNGLRVVNVLASRFASQVESRVRNERMR